MAIKIDTADLKPILGAFMGGGDSKITPPPAAPPMTPPPSGPPPATPAVAGFTEWSADPQNQQKVVHGITLPGQSIIPPNAADRPALTPPPQMAENAPPALPPAASPAVSMTPPPSSSAVSLTPPPAQSRLNTDQAELDRLRATGSGASQIKNKPGRIAAEVGDVAASLLLGDRAALLPGTTARNQMLQGRAAGRVEQDQSAAQNAADTAYKQEQTRLLPVTADIKQQGQDLKEEQAQNALKQNYAKMGFKQNPDGSWVEDAESPITKTRSQKDELLSAQVESAKAQKEVREAQAALARSKNDPNSPAFRQAQQRLQVAQQNANAANVRAKGYWGNYLKGAYNTDLQGNVLPGAPIIEDDAGNATAVGATNASSATKAQANAAQFNDVHGALDSIEKTANDLISSGGRLNSPGVAAALSRPKGELTKWLQGAGVKANLTPQERAYVQSIAAGHENIQALRKSAGGTATDSSVEKLDALIPDASTPDIDYLKGQTAQIRQTAERLGKGVTTATGGLKVRGQGSFKMTPPPAQGGPKAGDVIDGYRFSGGNPADQKNWVKQ